MSSTRAQQGDEESLPPSYEDFQKTEKYRACAEDTVPELDAGPAEVRAWLAELLRAKRHLDTEHIDRTVATWTVGTGHELRPTRLRCIWTFSDAKTDG